MNFYVGMSDAAEAIWEDRQRSISCNGIQVGKTPSKTQLETISKQQRALNVLFSKYGGDKLDKSTQTCYWSSSATLEFDVCVRWDLAGDYVDYLGNCRDLCSTRCVID